MSNAVIEFDNIHLTFVQGDERLEILRGASLTVNEGEIVALMGQSGSGKSTLLHICGLLERSGSGDLTICGEDCSGLNDNERTRIRRESIGFVYQYHHLLPEFSALENVEIPQIIAGLGKAEAAGRAHELLSWLGLEDRETHRPARLSGGEQQRVAIARALANAPRLLLADEPTGNLDPAIADDVFSVLLKLCRGAGLAAIVATHNPELAARADRTVELRDGILIPA